MNASSSAVDWPKPMSRNRLVSSGAMLPHAGPPEKPSNDVVPMITHSSATVPGHDVERRQPAQRLAHEQRRRASSAAATIRAMSPKYTPKPSP